MLNGILCTPPRQFAEHIAEANSRLQAESHPEDTPMRTRTGHGAPIIAVMRAWIRRRKRHILRKPAAPD